MSFISSFDKLEGHAIKVTQAIIRRLPTAAVRDRDQVMLTN
jgi:hypothetical protein